VPVPEFEIDAQPVSWSQFVEFVDDGGYDRPELWSPEGWAWLEEQSAGDGRRGPRHVEEIGTASGAVMQVRFGRRMRAAGQQPAMHVSWWEADAWARWAGRRLATEVEWEIAAHAAAGRGFRWGDVHEWTATVFRPWPGFVAGPWAGCSVPWFERARVTRGASFATRARMKHPRQRGFALPGTDERFCGFRTCAI
jgi:iron(II)-dependent oxidoreductase